MLHASASRPWLNPPLVTAPDVHKHDAAHVYCRPELASRFPLPMPIGPPAATAVAADAGSRPGFWRHHDSLENVPGRRRQPHQQVPAVRHLAPRIGQHGRIISTGAAHGSQLPHRLTSEPRDATQPPPGVPVGPAPTAEGKAAAAEAAGVPGAGNPSGLEEIHPDNGTAASLSRSRPKPHPNQ